MRHIRRSRADSSSSSSSSDSEEEADDTDTILKRSEDEKTEARLDGKTTNKTQARLSIKTTQLDARVEKEKVGPAERKDALSKRTKRTSFHRGTQIGGDITTNLQWYEMSPPSRERLPAKASK